MAEKQPNISLIPTEQKRRGFARATSFRRPKQPQGKSFKIAIVVLVALVLSSVGLFFWKQSLVGKEETLRIQLQQVRAERDASLEGELVELDKLLNSFEATLENHRLWSKLFAMVEERTVQGITLTFFAGDFETGMLLMRGLAPNYNLLAQQVKSFESEDEVMRVDVSNVKVNKVGLVAFNLTVIIKKSILR